MLSSFLCKQFLSYLEREPTDCRKCLDVMSLWKKPAYFSFVAYHCKSTNQIVWCGIVTPQDRPEYDVFTIFDEGDCITVGDLLINMVQVIDDELDLVMESEERVTFLAQRLIDVDECVLVNN